MPALTTASRHVRFCRLALIPLLGETLLTKSSICLFLALFRFAFLEFASGARRRRTTCRGVLVLCRGVLTWLVGLRCFLLILRHMRKPLDVTRLAHRAILRGLAKASLVGARDHVSLWHMRPPTLGPQTTRCTLGAGLGVGERALFPLIASRRMVEEVANLGGFLINCGHGWRVGVGRCE